MKSHQKMLLGIAVGTIAGLVANETSKDAPWLVWTMANLTGPLGQIFLRLLFMLVVPMLFAALVMGVCELDLRQLGRLGARTLGYTVVFSLIAVVIGLVLVNVIRPGEGMSAEIKEMARTSTNAPRPAPSEGAGSLLVTMVPDNAIKAAANGDMIGLIVFSLIFGAGLATLQSTGAERLKEVISGLYEVMMRLIDWVLKLAPLGVAALLFNMTSRLGLSILLQLAAYVGTVLLALAVHQFGVYSLSVRFLGGRSPLGFFRDIRLAMVTAFATSSSSATLPTALKVAEENLKLPRSVSRFVLTAGSAMNQNGTALFEGVTVLFLAQLFGVPLSVSDQFFVMLICVLAGIGTAGVPAGSIPVIAMILVRYNIPVEGLGLILGVDRFLDMCRTTLNVTGDLAAAVYVSRGQVDPDAAAAPSSARVQP
jgi:dicarboxylate/amino acid:cation (Na+ or H+) symporter, DAACS family